MFRTENLLRNRRIISTHRRAAWMKRLSMTIGINCLSSRAMFRLFQLPSLYWWCWPMSRLGRKSLLTNPCNTTFWPLLAKNSDHLTIHTNMGFWKSHGMMPSKMIENAKWLSKKHMQYWIVSQLGRLRPKWQLLGWFPFHSVPVLNCIIAVSVEEWN